MKVSSNTQKKKRTGRNVVIFLALALIVVVLASFLRGFRNRADSVNSQYTYAAAERRDIVETLTGSGTLQPADSYTVTSLVSGEILSAGFEEGDVLSKGDVLYQIDSSDAAIGIERAEITLAKARRNYDDKIGSKADLNITAPISGTITDITMAAGDSINTQVAVATIENTASLLITEYYSDDYKEQIYKGMPAVVSVPSEMQNLNGKVTEISYQKRISDSGISCFAVTVQITNPGSLKAGTEAACWLTNRDGGILYPTIVNDKGLEASSRTKVYSGVSGTLVDVTVRNQEAVAAGQIIMLLSSSTLDDEILNAADSLRDAELALQSQNDSLDKYTITAPIDGTIVDKYYKEGETSESAKSLCIIYDLSSLTLILDVDELDISQISAGQTAVIQAEAVPDHEYNGVITKVGINGTTTGGVTTYPVSIRIDDTKGLLPGMNVDVSIVVKERKNALSIPAGAVEHSSRVLVKTNDGSTGDNAPEGYRYAEVVTGITDDDYVEILSGITDGDTVAYIRDTAPTSITFGQPFRGEAPRSPMEGTDEAGGTAR